jgi:hypothetical protein
MTIFVPRHLRARREKVFGPARGIPLDRNAKVRVLAAARAYNARFKQPGQHWGPLTRACLQVLEALLWGFHNSRDGRCFPSYERIAERARCNRDTVYEAIKALEAADILTWVNRIARIEVREPDLFGRLARRWRTIRTSNAYLFRDPLPSTEGRPSANSSADGLFSSKSENPIGTQNQVFPNNLKLSTELLLDLKNPIHRALIRLGVTLGHI